jgi:hypothetical protein
MRSFLCCLALFTSSGLFAQQRQVMGTYASPVSGVELSISSDRSFTYVSKFDNPNFYRFEPIAESGMYSISGDTLILNPGLEPKPFVETAFRENRTVNDSIKLTFNHIRRYFDKEGKLVREDTCQAMMLDFAVNEWNRTTRRRLSAMRQVRCTFAGFIPKEIITSSRSVNIARPVGGIQKIFIGCYEMQGTNEFVITDAQANDFALDIYSNYYEDGQIRQMKMLIKNEKCIYTHQRKDGSFEKNTVWNNTNAILKKQR